MFGDVSFYTWRVFLEVERKMNTSAVITGLIYDKPNFLENLNNQNKWLSVTLQLEKNRVFINSLFLNIRHPTTAASHKTLHETVV